MPDERGRILEYQDRQAAGEEERVALEERKAKTHFGVALLGCLIFGAMALPPWWFILSGGWDSSELNWLVCLGVWAVIGTIGFLISFRGMWKG